MDINEVKTKVSYSITWLLPQISLLPLPQYREMEKTGKNQLQCAT